MRRGTLGREARSAGAQAYCRIARSRPKSQDSGPAILADPLPGLTALTADLRLAIAGREARSAKGGRTYSLARCVLIIAIGCASLTCRIGKPDLRPAEVISRRLCKMGQGQANDQGQNKSHEGLLTLLTAVHCQLQPERCLIPVSR